MNAKSMITTGTELIFVVRTYAVVVKAWLNAEKNAMALLYVDSTENKNKNVSIRATLACLVFPHTHIKTNGVSITQTCYQLLDWRRKLFNE
jgi:hypothetical protein